jgi:hypothetical protein
MLQRQLERHPLADALQERPRLLAEHAPHVGAHVPVALALHLALDGVVAPRQRGQHARRLHPGQRRQAGHHGALLLGVLRQVGQRHLDVEPRHVRGQLAAGTVGDAPAAGVDEAEAHLQVRGPPPVVIAPRDLEVRQAEGHDQPERQEDAEENLEPLPEHQVPACRRSVRPRRHQPRATRKTTGARRPA